VAAALVSTLAAQSELLRAGDPFSAAGTNHVASFSRSLTLAGKHVEVDFYLPRGAKEAPTAVVAHGFSRSRHNMAGWGELLAANGFIVAVPDLPAWFDDSVNSQGIGELFDRLNKGELTPATKPTGGGALLGHSMGGLCALLAAATNNAVRCWIGLDPPDIGHGAAKAAQALNKPGIVLRALPESWFITDGAQRVVGGLPGPMLALRVENATHCDPENPTDWLGEMACGKTDPNRRKVFEAYAVAALRVVFFADKASLEKLQAATNDPAVTDVVQRRLEQFGRWRAQKKP
jgi:dienelactone hydrolase